MRAIRPANHIPLNLIALLNECIDSEIEQSAPDHALAWVLSTLRYLLQIPLSERVVCI